LKPQYIVGLVVAGLAYGLIEPGRLTYAFGHATLYMLLPPLLFEGAWNLNYRAMLRQWRAIATLAIPGVALTALIVAGALSIVRVPFATALLCGAILSATDPLAVIAVFRRVRISPLLSTIVEAESLFNDAIAVVVYRAVLAIVLAGGGASMASVVAVKSLAGSLGGIALGVAVAFVAARLLRYGRGAPIQILATMVCAYGSYFAADALQCSGIFATIACGIALRSFERRWISLEMAGDVERFWDLGALAANALVFFLVGAALDLSIVTHAPAFVVATIVGVALARFVVAGLLIPGGFPRAWIDVIRVAGIRGALSLALAVALPASVPYREAIVAATFAVAIATIVSGSLTVPGVVARAARRPNG
jgi:CPA1 family monovalent cation:H+ antiporter